MSISNQLTHDEYAALVDAAWRASEHVKRIAADAAALRGALRDVPDSDYAHALFVRVLADPYGVTTDGALLDVVRTVTTSRAALVTWQHQHDGDGA